MENTVLTVEELNEQNPEKYFRDNLELEEFEGLETLVRDSNGVISWEKLMEEGVVKIEGKKVEGIYWKGDLDLRGTSIKSLRKLKIIMGDIYCGGVENLEDLGELEEVGGNCGLEKTSIKNLGKLKKVGGQLGCWNIVNLENLGDLEEVGGSLCLIGTKIQTLGNLKKVGLDLNCKHVKSLENLGELEEVGSHFDIKGTSIRTFSRLKKVGGILSCAGLKSLEDLGDLEEVLGNLNLRGTSIKSLGKLKKVGGHLDCLGLVSLEDIGFLEEVGGYLGLEETKIKTLGKLKKVGWYLNCQGLKNLEDLGELEEVGLNLDIRGTSIISFGKLKRVGGYLNCEGLKTLEDLGNLELVEGCFNIQGTSLDFQIQLNIQMEKSDISGNGQLKIKEYIIYGGDIKGIEKLLEQLKINGILNIKKNSFTQQIEVLYNVYITKVLQVDDLYVKKDNEKLFYKLYLLDKGELNLDSFKEIYGMNIDNLEDEELRKGAVKILFREYSRIKKEIEEKINKINKVTDIEEITEDERTKVKNQITELFRQFRVRKTRLENFGIEFE